MGQTYDLVVIGAGPGGYAAALEGAALGLRVALVERGELGGTCLNRGCIPTKTLAASAAAARLLRRAQEFGLEAELGRVSWERVQARVQAVVTRLRKGMAWRLRQAGVTFYQGTATLSRTGVVIETGEGRREELAAARRVVATGSSPLKPDSLGLDGIEARVLAGEEILGLASLPSRLVIVGGGVIGCEFAGIFAALGVEVTVVEALPRLFPFLDPEVSQVLERSLRRQGVKLVLGTAVAGVEEGASVGEIGEDVERNGGGGEREPTVRLADGRSFGADLVLLALGRRPASQGLGLEELGVELGARGEVPVNTALETKVEGLYALGDLLGPPYLAHVATAQGKVAARRAAASLRGAAGVSEAPPSAMGDQGDNGAGLAGVDWRAETIPQCLFTAPEVACVGLTETEATAQGRAVRSGQAFFLANGRALALGESEGLVKVVAEAEGPGAGRVLGVQIVGPGATDLIAEAALAVRQGLTVGAWAAGIRAHPSLPETLAEAVAACQ